MNKLVKEWGCLYFKKILKQKINNATGNTLEWFSKLY